MQLCLSSCEGYNCHEVSEAGAQLGVFVVALARCQFKPNVGVRAEVIFPEGEYFKVAISRELPSL